MRTRGSAACTIARARKHLDNMLQLAVRGGSPLTWLTPTRADHCTSGCVGAGHAPGSPITREYVRCAWGSTTGAMQRAAMSVIDGGRR